MYLLRLAAKNVFRKSWRSLLTAVPVLVGVMMTIFFWSLIDGVDNAVIQGQIRSDSGHFRILPQGYLEVEDEGELDLLIEDPEAVRRLLEPLGARVHPRLSFRGKLSDGRNSLIARGIGVDPETYFDDFALPFETTYESDDADPDHHGGLEPLWIGAALAADFGVVAGDTLTVLARTRFGSYTADEYLVRGLIRSSNPAIDNLAFFIPLDAARRLLDCDGAATEVVGLFEHRQAAVGLPQQLGPELAGDGLAVQTWLQRAEPMLRINRMRRKSMAFMVGIIILVAATSIMNTVVMAAFERIREIGAMRALGMQVEGIVALFLAEAMLIGTAGAVAGCTLGAGLVHALRDGLDFSKAVQAGGYTISMSTVLYLELDRTTVAVAFAIGLGMTLAAALYPSIKFSRLPLVEAMRR